MIKNHNILLLCGKNNILFEFSNNINIIKDDVYKKRNKYIQKIIQNIPVLYKFSLSNWINHLDKYTDIILFDSNFKYEIVKCIKKRNPEIQIILYFRNTVASRHKLDINKIKKLDVDIWSYNKDDCLKYELKYNRQNWNPKLSINHYNKTIKYDLIFIGAAKNRLRYLERMHQYCSENNLVDYIYVKDYADKEFNKNKKNQYMDYKEYIKKAEISSAIIDIVTEDNYALTLRPLEALFLEKKLITNYKKIKDEEFYNENNILILNDNYEDILNFLEKPIIPIKENIKLKYSCENWIVHFFKINNGQ